MTQTTKNKAQTNTHTTQTITLRPSHWLYNAGVIGFLRVLEEVGVQLTIKQNISFNYINVSKENFFEGWKKLSDADENKFVVGALYGMQKAYYSNQTEKSIKNKFERLLGKVQCKSKRRSRIYFQCFFCNQVKPKNEVSPLTQTFSNVLMASGRSSQNSFWNCNAQKFMVACNECSPILLCHHLGFIGLVKYEHIFINAPSFHLMWELNKYARQNMTRYRDIKALTGWSLVEFARQTQLTINRWTAMNVEVVVKRKDMIDFIQIPGEVVSVLTDARVSSLLHHIGETKILQLVMDMKFGEIMHVGEQLERMDLKGELKDQDQDFIKYYFPYSYRRAQSNPSGMAFKMFQLYSYIMETLTQIFHLSLLVNI